MSLMGASDARPEMFWTIEKNAIRALRGIVDNGEGDAYAAMQEMTSQELAVFGLACGIAADMSKRIAKARR